jgi:hypothetical protein
LQNEKSHLLTHGALANANANAKVSLEAFGFWLLAWYLANYEVIYLKLIIHPFTVHRSPFTVHLVTSSLSPSVTKSPHR